MGMKCGVRLNPGRSIIAGLIRHTISIVTFAADFKMARKMPADGPTATGIAGSLPTRIHTSGNCPDRPIGPFASVAVTTGGRTRPSQFPGFAPDAPKGRATASGGQVGF